MLAWERGPVLSVLVPAAGGDAAGVTRLLDSLRALGRRWEACVAVEPGSRLPTSPGSRRVRVVEVAPAAGRAARYAACLARAGGRYLCLLETGETLEPETVVQAIRLLDGEPTIDLVYGDEDRVSAAGLRHSPFLRPGWSPDYLLSALYVERAFIARRATVETLGGFRAEYDPAPEWDLLVRIAARGRRPGPRGCARGRGGV